MTTRATDPRDEAIRRKILAALPALFEPHGGEGEAHVGADRLAALAAGELPLDEAAEIDRHLIRCADRRCPDALRDVLADQAAARDALYGRRAEDHTDPSIALPHRVAFHRAPSAPPPPPRERNTPTLQRSYLPKAPPSSRRSPVYPPPAGSAPRLAVVVAGVRYEVDKDRFVVGRGGMASDLAIDDPSVSRQHAVIEHAGEDYWLVDMGSTNGVEYRGQRIARRRIAHGDRFVICDHELEFLLH